MKIENIIKLSSFILSTILLFLLYKNDNMVVFYLLAILSMVVGVVVYIYNQQKQTKTISATNHQHITDKIDIKPIKTDVTFDDIGGFESIKNDIYEIVDFLQNPIKFKKADIKMPKGILLVGSPGVGKTLIAKALANELGVPFFYQSGSSFVQKYVGIGAKRVRELFNKAKLNSPSIIFIDEIDAIAKSRDSVSTDERESTLNELLIQMDGFNSSDNTIVIAATNRVEVLDEAILRAGRFDRKIYIPLPAFNDRVAILSKYLKKKNHNIDIEYIGKLTSGFSGAELETLINESALMTLRDKQAQITTQIILDTINRVKHGILQNQWTSEFELDIVSIYKASKALRLLKIDYNFNRISMVENDVVLDENKILSSSELIEYIKYYLSGYIALKKQFNEYYNYGLNDRQRAYKIYELYKEIDKSSYNIEDIENALRLEISDSIDKIKQLATLLKDKENISKDEIVKIF